MGSIFPTIARSKRVTAKYGGLHYVPDDGIDGGTQTIECKMIEYKSADVKYWRTIERQIR